MNYKRKIEVLNIESENDLTALITGDYNFSYFLFCKSGNVEIVIDSTLIEIKTNDVVNIINGSDIEIKNVSSEVNLTMVAYSEDIKNLLALHSLIIFCPITGLLKSEINSEDFSDLMFYVKKIRKYTITKINFEITLLHLILIVKDLNTINNLNNSVRRIKNEIILTFINLLDKSYKTDKSIEYYCSKLNITTKTLYRAFKDDLGFSPKEFVNFKLNMEAKRLLIHSRLSIKEISNELGFKSQYYFTNFFKKSNSITPTLYKEEMSDFSIKLS